VIRAKYPSIKPGQNRQGSLYVSVLLTGITVTMIGLSALMVGRLNHHSHRQLNNSTAARLHAHSALQMGMEIIKENPDWRQLGNTLLTDVALGNGSISLNVTDPTDGDLTDDPNDPVLLNGIGKAGDAIYATQITIIPGFDGVSALESAIHAGDDVQSSNNVPYCDHVASANDDILSLGAQYQMDVEASDVISGNGYLLNTTRGVPQRTLPTTDDVLSFYLANGTTIDPASLPTSFAEILRNNDFESDSADNWSAETSTLIPTTFWPLAGARSLAVFNRQTANSGPSQDVTRLVTPDRSYELQFWLRAATNQTFYAHLIVTDRNGVEHADTMGGLSADVFWRRFNGQITVPNVDIASARILINTNPTPTNINPTLTDTSTTNPTTVFVLDAASLRDSTSVSNMDQVLLSPSSNPFGDTNPDGIYVLDMNGARLTIRNSRIHGTLVLLNPANVSQLGDGTPFAMSPANPDYPTLLVSGGQVRINPSRFDLDERTLQRNLNPPDAPWPNVDSNTTQTDSFESTIRGLIYSDEDLFLRDFSGTGTIIGARDVDIQLSFSLKWNDHFMRNPPPGFEGESRFQILRHAAKRITN